MKITKILVVVACGVAMAYGAFADNSARIAEIKAEIKQLRDARLNSRRRDDVAKVKAAEEKESKLFEELRKLELEDSEAKAKAKEDADKAKDSALDARKLAFEKELGANLELFNLVAYTKVEKGKHYYYTHNNVHLFSTKDYFTIYQVIEDGVYLIATNVKKFEPLFCIVDPDGDYVDKDNLKDGIYKCVGAYSNGIISVRKLERVKIDVPKGLIEDLDARNNKNKLKRNWF